MDALLSIKPVFSELIFVAVTMGFEFRRIVPRQPIDPVIVYASRPVRKIVDHFQASPILHDTPGRLWSETCHRVGISRQYFDRYFADRPIAHATTIVDPVSYDNAIDPKEVIAGFRAPQSFMYLESGLPNTQALGTPPRSRATCFLSRGAGSLALNTVASSVRTIVTNQRASRETACSHQKTDNVRCCPIEYSEDIRSHHPTSSIVLLRE